MAPRKYEKKKRAETTEETRGRILAASLALHSTKGFEATWQDIADRAGVAVGTVYYHFPTIDDLVPACSTLARTLVPPPTVEILEGVRGLSKRVGVLVSALFGYYSGNQGAMRNLYRDRNRITILDAMATEVEGSLGLLVRELDPTLSADTAKKVEALLDFRTWDSFNARGFAEEVIVQTVSSLVRAMVSKG